MKEHCGVNTSEMGPHQSLFTDWHHLLMPWSRKDAVRWCFLVYFLYNFQAAALTECVDWGSCALSMHYLTVPTVEWNTTTDLSSSPAMKNAVLLCHNLQEELVFLGFCYSVLVTFCSSDHNKKKVLTMAHNKSEGFWRLNSNRGSEMTHFQWFKSKYGIAEVTTWP